MEKNRGNKNPKRKRVQFVFETADALEVAVSGDFNGWHPRRHIMKISPIVTSKPVKKTLQIFY
jgi:hypothetical protein